MFLYEITDTDDQKQRKYLVVADDTDRAKELVATKVHKPESVLRAKHANEDEARDRIVAGIGFYWGTKDESAWNIYKHHKREGKEAVITDYIL